MLLLELAAPIEVETYLADGEKPTPDPSRRDGRLVCVKISVYAFFDFSQLVAPVSTWKSNNALNTPTGHMLSSQISCVNQLFPLMKSDESVSLLSILNSVQERYHFVKILTNPLDKTDCNGNICFEFIWKNRTLLGERAEKRGAMCTSIDAIVYAETEGHRRILIPIEWKYVETYEHKRAVQSSIDRYTSRLDNSSNIKECASSG